jgi:hypothetical protein
MVLMGMKVLLAKVVLPNCNPVPVGWVSRGGAPIANIRALLPRLPAAQNVSAANSAFSSLGSSFYKEYIQTLLSVSQEQGFWVC